MASDKKGIKDSEPKHNRLALHLNSPAYRITLAAILVALGVSLSIFPGSIPVGPTKVFPFQHMVNVIAGIMLGPAYAGGIAAMTGMIRIGIGTGTFFALPGGIPGGIVVGIVFRYLIRRDLAGLTEPIGTALGALISAFFVAPALGTGPLPPFLGLTAQWQLFTIFFLMSSVPGAVLGYLVTIALRRRGILEGS